MFLRCYKPQANSGLDFYEREINGVVGEKWNDGKLKAQFFIYGNSDQDSTIISQPQYGDDNSALWKYIERGDSIVKKKYSSDVLVIRSGIKNIFETENIIGRWGNYQSKTELRINKNIPPFKV